MKRLFGPLLILTAAMFAYAPVAIQNAPYESTMGLVQKIFYFHVPSWFVMFSAAGVCGIAGAVFLFTGRKGAHVPEGTGGVDLVSACDPFREAGPPREPRVAPACGEVVSRHVRTFERFGEVPFLTMAER